MALKDFIDVIPAEKQEAFKAEIAALDEKMAKMVSIGSKEEAQRLVETNEFLKAIQQSYLDKKDAERLKTFEAERLPKLLEEEKKKGAKPEWQIEIEKLKAENEAQKNETAKEKQKARAVAKAAELGLPAKIAERAAGLTDDETDAALKELTETLVPWKDGAVKGALEKVGAQPAPQGGAATPPQDLKALYKEAESKNDGVAMLRIKAQMQAAKE